MRLICWSILAACVGAVGLASPPVARPAPAWSGVGTVRGAWAPAARSGRPAAPDRAPAPAAVLPDFDPEPREDDEVWLGLAAAIGRAGHPLATWPRPAGSIPTSDATSPGRPRARAFPIRC